MDVIAHGRSSSALPELRRRARWVPALLVLHLVFALPDRVDSMGWSAWLRLPVELPIAVLILFVWPRRRWPTLQTVAAALLGLLVLFRCVDFATQATLGRPFRPMLDLPLVGASVELVAGALGPAGAAALMVVALLAWGASVVVLYRALGALRPPERLRGRLAAAAAVAAVLAVGVYLGAAGGRVTAVTTASTSASLRDHLQALWLGFADRARFRAELLDDPFAWLEGDRLLARLRGIDVLFLFVESYGRSTLENPRYAPTADRALAEFEQAAVAAGFGARSAWVSAPIRGGQSWLAHATLLSGLRIDDQRRWESLVLSERRTLVDDFRRAGWRTLAVLPATVRPWPEGRFFGFDRIYAARDLGYEGEAFGWVTMPDQYTLSALRRLELDRPDRPAIMATVALISSHAPWTPIPRLLDWHDVGNGAAFTDQTYEGDAPEVVWRDTERIRAQYLRSIEYVLRTLGSWVASHGRDDSIFVVLGDHQPVGFVAGDDASFDVPIHVLSRNPGVLDVVDRWGWSRGMRPAAGAPIWPMEEIRRRVLAAFSADDAFGAEHALGTEAGAGDAALVNDPAPASRGADALVAPDASPVEPMNDLEPPDPGAPGSS